MSTQTEFPWRATLRTIIQAIIGFAVLLPIIVPIVNETLGQYLPDQWEAWTVGAAGAVTALIACVTRLMAVPAVDAWLDRWLPWLASQPGSEYIPERAV